MRRSRNATCLFGANTRMFLHPRAKIALCQKHRFQVSLELEKHAQSHARRAGEEQPPKDIQSTEVQDNCYAHLLGEVEPCGAFPQVLNNYLYEEPTNTFGKLTPHPRQYQSRPGSSAPKLGDVLNDRKP